MVLATGVLAAACGTGGAPARYESDRAGSVPACTATAVQALERHVTLATLPGPCGGLSRAQLNLALGRAIYEVAGAGQHKAAWRRRAAAAEARLTRLIKSLPRPAVHPRPVPPPAPAGPADRWGTGLATLATWLCTMGIGAFMLVPWIRRRGRIRRGPRPPARSRGHPRLRRRAGAGLLAWIAYLVTGWGRPGLAGDSPPAGGYRGWHGHIDRVDGPGVPAGSRARSRASPSRLSPSRLIRSCPRAHADPVPRAGISPRPAGPRGVCGSSLRSCTAWPPARRSCWPCSPW